jgi:hypothetical protein
MTSRTACLSLLLAFAWLASSGAAASCTCQCVEGAARTVCTSIEEAQANPSRCDEAGRTIACTAPPTATDAPQRYAAPSGASDCRERRLWDPKTNTYDVIAKVCDLAPRPDGA